MSERILTPGMKGDSPGNAVTEQATTRTTTRTEFGFLRTACACALCVENCKHIPGYLVPNDVERMAKALGCANAGEFAYEHLLASPGATVMQEGRIFQIPTLVPKRKETDGSCVFLDEHDRCRVHEVAPFGCAFFDHRMDGAEANRRSGRGLREIAQHWATLGYRGGYAVLWRLLRAAGHHAVPPHVARAEMKRATSGKTRRVS